MVLALAVYAAFGGTQPLFPVGSYRADASKAPGRSRGVLNAYFGRAYLVIQQNGTFALCGLQQRGFWRKHSDRFVLVYDGIFTVRDDEPAEILRRVWPRDIGEGIFLRKGPNGTLILNDWGRVAGPVIFRPLPKRTVSELIIASTGEDITAEVEEAMAATRGRVEAEWPELLRFINNPNHEWQQRHWAASMLQGVTNPQAIEAAARMIFDLNPTHVSNRDRLIRRSLARIVARHPSPGAADLLIKAETAALLSPADVAPALGKLNRSKDVPILVDWLGAVGEHDRIRSLEALTLIGAEEGLAQARLLVNSEKDSVQLAAYGLIARTSPDTAERKVALAKLARWLKSSDLLISFAAVDALCHSHSPEALSHLVAVLNSDMPAVNRRYTATALGKLGDPRAVPALIEAKVRRDGPGGSDVKRAAAEALVRLGRTKRRVA